MYVKPNLSSEFNIVDEHLIRDLEPLGPWDAVMVADQLDHDASPARTDRVCTLLPQCRIRTIDDARASRLGIRFHRRDRSRSHPVAASSPRPVHHDEHQANAFDVVTGTPSADHTQTKSSIVFASQTEQRFFHADITPQRATAPCTFPIMSDRSSARQDAGLVVFA